MKQPLVKYRLIIKYLAAALSDGRNAGPQMQNLYVQDHLFDDYASAKKAGVKTVNAFLAEGKDIREATIEPIMLQENLLGD